ncbi:hypothetical protein QN277_025884 [Acacia crassicarpa]|uniref:TPR1-like CTLH-containing domain-containing protein n=1 Tax=Acacia crassicarpa TaxID=499986 RepID=A0AAE1J9J4_9FABA|nr:hypothetical protein QN277_025884 [Acacia crassicarpa]
MDDLQTGSSVPVLFSRGACGLVYLQATDHFDSSVSCGGELRRESSSTEARIKYLFQSEVFWDTIVSGEWEKAENYLSAFGRTGDSFLLKKIFHKMREQKCQRGHAQVKVCRDMTTGRSNKEDLEIFHLTLGYRCQILQK